MRAAGCGMLSPPTLLYGLSSRGRTSFLPVVKRSPSQRKPEAEAPCQGLASRGRGRKEGAMFVPRSAWPWGAPPCAL